MQNNKRGSRRNFRRFRQPEVSLTPLIDTALTLLIIFMITVPIVSRGIKVDLPDGQSNEVGSEQELVVTLNKEEKLFFNSYPIESSKLVETVKKAMGPRQDLPVYIRADQTVSYGKVINIVDRLKLAGVKFVAMSTRMTQKSNAISDG